MRLSDVEKPTEQGENVLPLVNVVFLLLIFFMIAGTLTSPEKFALQPPQAEQEKDLADQKLQLQVNNEGQLAIRETAITVDELKQRLAEKPAKIVQVKANADLPAKELIKLMETLTASGVSELQLITQKVP